MQHNLENKISNRYYNICAVCKNYCYIYYICKQDKRLSHFYMLFLNKDLARAIWRKYFSAQIIIINIRFFKNNFKFWSDRHQKPQYRHTTFILSINEYYIRYIMSIVVDKFCFGKILLYFSLISCFDDFLSITLIYNLPFYISNGKKYLITINSRAESVAPHLSHLKAVDRIQFY